MKMNQAKLTLSLNNTLYLMTELQATHSLIACFFRKVLSLTILLIKKLKTSNQGYPGKLKQGLSYINLLQ